MAGINPLPDETTNAALKPTASALGEASGTIFTAGFNLILTPLRKYNIRKEQELTDYAERIHKHIDSIPEQHRDASKVDLILKAVDDSKYRLNEETMREAFARLIANGLDNRINAEFFPAYSEILSNMSVQEAILLKLLYSNTGTQIATEQLMSESKTAHATHPIASRVYLFDDKTDTSGQFTIPVDLLQRSGLINSSETNFLSHEYYTRQYTAYENQFNQLKDTFPGMSDDEELAFRKGFIDFTTFGKSFVKFIV